MKVEEENVQVGEYESTFSEKPAYRIYYYLKMTDRITGDTIATGTLAGTMPPYSIDSELSYGKGDAPTESQLEDWIHSVYPLKTKKSS